jgi:FixJ family two-component response regulator
MSAWGPIADIAQIPACLVADVSMPAMSGIELYRHLIDAGRAIPTILVTAYPKMLTGSAP